MSIRSQTKRWGLFSIVLVIILAAFIAFRDRSPATGDAVQFTFAGYTNAPNTDQRFTVFSVSNRASYSIRWRGDWVELEGYPARKARIRNSSLPECRYDSVLKPKDSIRVAVGEPSLEESETGRWRFTMLFSRYSMRERWMDIAFRHDLPLKIGPFVLADSVHILSSSNIVTVSTDWVPE